MVARDPASWLPSVLLLLWVPGCWCLHSPHMVTGPVGGSLSVPCPYKEEYADDVKYWCKDSWLTLCRKIVETSGSEREGRSGRVSIRDHPAKLTFTVTLENLTEEDAGTYWCGIDRHLSFDPKLQVEVSVSPAPRRSTPPATITPQRSTPPATITVTTTSTTTMQTTTPTSTALTNQRAGPEKSQSNLWVLSLLAIVLLLMLGISLLAWRMIPRQVKATKNSAPPRNSSQGDPCYANLEMKTQTLPREPGDSRQVEVVYSTVAVPQEDLHYSTVVFDTPNQNSTARRMPSQRPTQPEPEYSVVKRQSEPQYSTVKRT